MMSNQRRQTNVDRNGRKKVPLLLLNRGRRRAFVLAASSILFGAAAAFATNSFAQTPQYAPTNAPYGATYYADPNAVAAAPDAFAPQVDVAPEGADAEEDSSFFSFVKKTEFAGAAVIAGHQTKGYGSKSGVDGDVTVDLEWTIPLDSNDSFYGAIEAGDGGGIDMRVPSYCGLNFDSLDDTALRVCELSYDREWGRNGTFRTRVGYLDLTSDFDANEYANDENSQFMSYSLVNNIAIDRHPLYSFGGLAWWTPNELFDAGVGYYETDDDGLDVFGECLLLAQLAGHLSWGERKGNYRGYVWTNTAPHEEIGGDRDDLNNYGWGLSCDQEITNMLGIFGRYGTQRSDVSEFGATYSCGLELHQFNATRPNDVFGVAYGTTFLGDKYKEANPDANLEDENHLECYYRFQLKEYFAISPSVQWLTNPAGDADAEALWVPGLRANAEF